MRTYGLFSGELIQASATDVLDSACRKASAIYSSENCVVAIQTTFADDAKIEKHNNPAGIALGAASEPGRRNSALTEGVGASPEPVRRPMPS